MGLMDILLTMALITLGSMVLILFLAFRHVSRLRGDRWAIVIPFIIDILGSCTFLLATLLSIDSKLLLFSFVVVLAIIVAGLVLTLMGALNVRKMFPRSVSMDAILPSPRAKL
jgi:hypothetical protein